MTHIWRVPALRQMTIGISLTMVVIGFSETLLFALGDGMWLIRSLPVVMAGMAVAGLGIVWAVVAIGTAYQRRSGQEIQGRVSAAANMVFSVPQTISIAAGAALITVVDYRIEILTMFVGVGLSALYLLTRGRAEAQLDPALA